MKIGNHLEELRIHLIRIIFYTSMGFIIAAIFYKDLWNIAMYPRLNAAKMLSVNAEEAFPLQLIGPAEGISAVAGLCLKATIGVFLPLIFFECWKFISPALHKKEKRAIKYILGAGTILFFSGVLVAYFIALPTGLKFLVSFDSTLSGTVTEWRVDNYFGLLTMACFGFGICFETPLIMLSLTIAGLLSPEQIIKYWRHATIIICLLGALFTPPDPFTMLILAGAMLLLFFLGYYLSRLAYKKQNPERAAEHKDEFIEEDLGED